MSINTEEAVRLYAHSILKRTLQIYLLYSEKQNEKSLRYSENFFLNRYLNCMTQLKHITTASGFGYKLMNVFLVMKFLIC